MEAGYLVFGILCIDFQWITFFYVLTPPLLCTSTHLVPVNAMLFWGSWGKLSLPLPLIGLQYSDLSLHFSASLNSVIIFHLLSALQSWWDILSANEDSLFPNLFCPWFIAFYTLFLLRWDSKRSPTKNKRKWNK